MGLVASVCQPSTLRMLIWPEASKAQNSIAAVSAEGSTVCVLIRRLKLLVQPFDGVGGAHAFPLARRQPREGEQPLAGLLQAVGDGAMLEPPLADEGLAPPLDLLTGRRVDHVVIIGGDLLAQALGRVRQQVAMLVHGAALHRHVIPDGSDRGLEPGRAVNDEELWPPQTVPDEVVEHRAPGLSALAAHG